MYGAAVWGPVWLSGEEPILLIKFDVFRTVIPIVVGTALLRFAIIGLRSVRIDRADEGPSPSCAPTRSSRSRVRTGLLNRAPGFFLASPNATQPAPTAPTTAPPRPTSKAFRSLSG